MDKELNELTISEIKEINLYKLTSDELDNFFLFVFSMNIDDTKDVLCHIIDTYPGDENDIRLTNNRYKYKTKNPIFFEYKDDLDKVTSIFNSLAKYMSDDEKKGILTEILLETQDKVESNSKLPSLEKVVDNPKILSKLSNDEIKTIYEGIFLYVDSEKNRLLSELISNSNDDDNHIEVLNDFLNRYPLLKEL